MNRIYKVIWSRVKNSYVVVSEIAGTARKSGGVRVSKNALAAALTAFLLTSSVAGAVDNVIVGNTEAPNAVTDTTDSTVVGIENKVSKEKDDVIVGKKNTIKDSEDVRVVGKGNTVTNSDRQNVFGDNNSITNRDAGTVSGYHGITRNSTSDLVIGMGNKIKGNDTYMKGTESLTVIGNNNEMVNPGAGIVIGDNQKVGAIRESVVIGSMTPEEKADPDIQQKADSVVVGYYAQSGTRDGGGMNVALGHGAKAYGWQETVTGIKSIVEAGDSGYDGYLASVYGGLNTVASNKADQNDGMANTVVGTLNKTEGANGALVFGAGNSVTHSFGTAPTDEDGNSMNEHWSEVILFGGQGYAKEPGPSGHDEIRKAMGLAMSTGGGSVVTMGNGNTSDYAVHSQIIGSGNILTGTANTPSINNTINGYANTGRNVERVSMMGTGNNISGSTADVVIGDYHHKDGGKNNVILGSMATEKKTVEKTYTMKDASGNVILEKKYKVTENVPIKSHTANISNAVMLGYNTDVEKDGGVALGADSIASVDKGVEGYDPAAGDHANDTTGTWKATAAAVSVGKAADPTSAAVTRQITNVAAGTQDTDAVNVAQLKKAVAGAADGNDTLVSGSNGLSLSGKTLSMSVKDTAGNEVTGSVDLSSVADGNDKLVSDNNALTLDGKKLSMSVKDTAGNEVKGSVDLEKLAAAIDTDTTYTMSGEENADNTTTIKLKGSDGKESKVTVATKDTRNTVKAGENVTLATAANTFGGTEYTVNVKADGKVENGSTKIVSGNTVYHETHVKNDGNYVKKENSAGDNLTILDKQVGKNTTNITNLGNTINNLNGKLGTLDNRISKVGAGAAALAALHPLDFDPHDKWDIAAGFGNYRNASAAAVGLFYRPNERTMMSLGWTMGDDRNMINAGVSVKLGRGDVYTRYSKVEMANQIKDLKEKNDKMQAENKEMRSELDELKAQVAALAAKK